MSQHLAPLKGAILVRLFLLSSLTKKVSKEVKAYKNFEEKLIQSRKQNKLPPKPWGSNSILHQIPSLINFSDLKIFNGQSLLALIQLNKPQAILPLATKE
ncbi:MAG: hypothetical protein ACFHWX_06945 [Bacteroidota bacterium]